MEYFDRDARLNAALKGLGSTEPGVDNAPGAGGEQVGPDGKIEYKPEGDPYTYKYDPETGVYEVFGDDGALVTTAAPGSPTYDAFVEHRQAYMQESGGESVSDVRDPESPDEASAMRDAMSRADRAIGDPLASAQDAANMAEAREAANTGESLDAPIPELSHASSLDPQDDEFSEDEPASLSSISGTNLLAAARRGMRKAAQKRNAARAPRPGIDTP